MEEKLLAGKVAIITGGARGIGRGIAKVFCESGASVVISDKNTLTGEEACQSLIKAGLDAYFYKTDLCEETEINKMINHTIQKCGRIDILVNNARPRLQHLPFSESLKEWDLAMDVLLKAPALLVKYALPYLVKSGGGSVLNISSTNAFFVSHQPATYHIAKAGIIHLTRYLAHEFGSQGIRVNAICPGLVDLYDKNGPLTSDPVNDIVTKSVVPLKRASIAEEIGQAALFLSSHLSKYITGHALTIDGGITLGDHFIAAREAYMMAIDKEKEKRSGAKE